MGQSSPQTQRGIPFGNRFFAPTVIPSILTLVFLCLMVNLGFWQLRRAEFKENMVDRLEQRSKLADSSLDELMLFEGDINDFPISVSGEYLEDRDIFLDNRIHNGIAGYHVLTPLLVQGKILLINRGWVAREFSRQTLPAVQSIEGSVSLSGLVRVPNPNYFILKEDDYSEALWPLLIQKIDLEKSAQLFDYPLIPFVLRLQPDNSTEFVREWQSNFMGPEKHYGYALQWFSLSFALLTIYLVVNTHRKESLELK